jgi:hypothetical protein
MTEALKHTIVSWIGVAVCVVAVSQCSARETVAVNDRIAREAEAKASVSRAQFEAQKASTETTAAIAKAFPQLKPN